MWLQLWFIFAKFWLSIFMNQTDLNGFLSRGSMFILSEDQIVSFLTNSGFSMPSNGAAKILDIGAGDGNCTARIQTALKRLDQSGSLPRVMVTETSWIMRKRLAKYENFSLVEVEDVKGLQDLHLVSCLNVLDRCADPHQMLEDIHNILSPNGRAILALVLPYYHYVESSKCNPNQTRYTMYVNLSENLTCTTPLQIRRTYLFGPCCHTGPTIILGARPAAVIAASTNVSTVSAGRALRRRRESSLTCCTRRASR